jgi:Chalcone isomerase-like
MMKSLAIVAVIISFLVLPFSGLAADVEVLGVTFPEEKVIEGKTLKLNGVAVRKALGIVKVFVGALYLESPTSDAKVAIESEQIKHFHLHYLTNKATAKKLQDGFVKAITKANPSDLVAAHQEQIEQYTSWLDADMAPGETSKSTYVPGKGLSLEYKGQLKGTIEDKEFAQMYYRYNLGEKAKKSLREGYLGKH